MQHSISIDFKEFCPTAWKAIWLCKEVAENLMEARCMIGSTLWDSWFLCHLFVQGMVLGLESCDFGLAARHATGPAVLASWESQWWHAWPDVFMKFDLICVLMFFVYNCAAGCHSSWTTQHNNRVIVQLIPLTVLQHVIAALVLEISWTVGLSRQLRYVAIEILIFNNYAFGQHTLTSFGRGDHRDNQPYNYCNIL